MRNQKEQQGSRGLLPSYLQPSYLPKIKIGNGNKPIHKKHIFRSALIVISLFMIAKSNSEKKD